MRNGNCEVILMQFKGEPAASNPYPVCNAEDRLEANAFFANLIFS